MDEKPCEERLLRFRVSNISQISGKNRKEKKENYAGSENILLSSSFLNQPSFSACRASFSLDFGGEVVIRSLKEEGNDADSVSTPHIS
eukprot:467108-Pelagomonas_calceolata.AAC.10